MAKKKKPRRLNGIAKALASPVFRQRVKPSKKKLRQIAREKFFSSLPEDSQ